MDVQKLINELAEKEITLWCEGANLKYKAPKGAMTADLLSKIKSGKSEIIDFLNELLQKETGKIIDLTYLSTEQLDMVADMRKAIFDIYCENERGEKFIKEFG